MGDARHDDLIEVAQDDVERLRLLGNDVRKHRPYLPGLDRRGNRSVVDGLHVPGKPLNDFMPMPTELVRGHVI